MLELRQAVVEVDQRLNRLQRIELALAVPAGVVVDLGYTTAVVAAQFEFAVVVERTDRWIVAEGLDQREDQAGYSQPEPGLHTQYFAGVEPRIPLPWRALQTDRWAVAVRHQRPMCLVVLVERFRKTVNCSQPRIGPVLLASNTVGPETRRQRLPIQVIAPALFELHCDFGWLENQHVRSACLAHRFHLFDHYKNQCVGGFVAS